MKAKAISRNIHQSPRKMRKTLNSIRGLKVGVAMNMLHFSTEKAAAIIEKTLRSAVANLMQGLDDANLDPELLGIDEAFVDGGPVMKRFRAASMGRAAKLRRPTSHLTIVVSNEK